MMFSMCYAKIVLSLTIKPFFDNNDIEGVKALVTKLIEDLEQ